MRFSLEVENLVARLRGLPEAGSRDDTAGAAPVGSLLEVLWEKHRIDYARPEQALMERWKEIVGPANAPRCAPVKLTGARLTVAVPNASLRQTLALGKHLLLERVRATPGCEDVREIFLVGG